MLSELLKVYPKEKIIETLVPFLTKERIQTIDEVLANRMRSVQIAIERPYDIHNGLAVVRTAEALGASHVHFINAQMKKGQGKGTTKGTMKWVHLHRHPSLKEFHEAKGEVLLAGASADGELSLENLPLERPICFLFGNEKEGISEEAKKRCDLLFRVPMFGMVESYNLSVAAAITLYDFLRKKRKKLQRNGDLDTQEMIEEKARFYVRSLGIEQSNEILKRYLS
ncbi:MAG: RNA methyltransferase [Simkaniaceae bacterium]|jgi:tRNA (guanosine-2'-O-)-methyltransferase|nr:MAG: RNA methyltransferase [Simkaniaceae bacterium]